MKTPIVTSSTRRNATLGTGWQITRVQLVSGPGTHAGCRQVEGSNLRSMETGVRSQNREWVAGTQPLFIPHEWMGMGRGIVESYACKNLSCVRTYSKRGMVPTTKAMHDTIMVAPIDMARSLASGLRVFLLQKAGMQSDFYDLRANSQLNRSRPDCFPTYL